MNANELADMAENACCAYQKEIAAMLRQQQAEIEALKAKIDEMAGEIMTLENRMGMMGGYGHN
jgi:cell division protein FtsB